MGIRKTPRFLAGVSAFAILGVAACGEQTVDTGGSQPEAVDEGQRDILPGSEADGQTEAAPDYRMAGEGEGEGSGAATGGEMGIDPEVAANDPVVYLTALEVMRAHYIAGLDALEAGERSAGAEMFSHPISEIYVDLEPVLAGRGVEPFMDTLTEASVAPYQGASDAEIETAVNAVLEAIDRAEAAAPEADDMALVRAKVLADLIERSALQYEFAASADAPEGAFLDGYGFARTAQAWADRHMESIVGDHGAFAEQARTALTLMSEVYPGPVRPEELTVPAEDVLAVNAAVQSALPAG